MGWSGRVGLNWSHKISMRFVWIGTSSLSDCSNVSFHSFHSFIEISSGSQPINECLSKFYWNECVFGWWIVRFTLESHLLIEGTSLLPSLINFQQVGSSSFSAWAKYLPSVQSKASFSVITAVPISQTNSFSTTDKRKEKKPFDPVNWEMNSRRLYRSATYSFYGRTNLVIENNRNGNTRWGSVVGTIYASTIRSKYFFDFISCRSLFNKIKDWLMFQWKS